MDIKIYFLKQTREYFICSLLDNLDESADESWLRELLLTLIELLVTFSWQIMKLARNKEKLKAISSE